MRIAIFTNNYFPNPYGVARSIESFHVQFEKMGHEVYIFAPETRGYEDKNPNVFRYPAWDFRYQVSYPLPVPYSIKTDKIINSLDFDIIHSQHPTLLGLAAKRWRRKKKVPLVFTWHTLYDQYTNFIPIIPDKLAAWWVIKKAVSYANKCDQVVVPTESIKDIIKNWGVKNENIISIPTGVDQGNFENSDSQAVRDKLGIEADEKIILTVSRLTEEKNVEFLFEAVLPFIEENEKIKFLIAGDGYLLPKLKEMVAGKKLANKVIFAGVVERDEMKNYYAAADVFVYASKSETQGMILTEAMYMGVPIVAVRATGAQDVIIDGETGFLVGENKDEFAAKIGDVLGNEELRNRFSENSKKIAREKYTDEVCAKKMVELYEQVIERYKYKKQGHKEL